MSTHINNRDILTIIVVNKEGQPVEGARVSITPSDTTARTNHDGKTQFQLGEASRYDITATYNRSTVTVPYYVTEAGATQMVINPVYVEAREKELNPSAWPDLGFFSTISIVLGVVLVFFILWKIFRRLK